MAKIFYTPPGYSGQAELSASTGLEIIDQGRWRFSQAGYNDGATFGLSLTWPDNPKGEYSYGAPTTVKPQTGGLLSLAAKDWPISTVGNTLQSYDDPTYGVLPATQCRIQVTGRWVVTRQQNSNSFNGIGVFYDAHTSTDQGDRAMNPSLLNLITPLAVYTIQGADVTGGALDTFSDHDFWCRATESATSNNSNKEFQSNTIIRPVWAYTYTMSWEIDV